MLMNRGVCGLDGARVACLNWSTFARRPAEAAVPTCFGRVPAEVGNVFHAGLDSGDAFVIQRSPFPAIGDCVRIRANFVRAKALQVLALTEEHSHVRAEELVRGAGEEIAIERCHVDESVGPVWTASM